MHAIVPPVCLEELMGRCLGDATFARQMLEGFVQSGPDRLEEIRAMIERGDRVEMGRRIHRIKGTAATLAARPMHALLEDMERQTTESPASLTEIYDYLARVTAEFERVCAFVDALADDCAGECA